MNLWFWIFMVPQCVQPSIPICAIICWSIHPSIFPFQFLTFLFTFNLSFLFRCILHCGGFIHCLVRFCWWHIIQIIYSLLCQLLTVIFLFDTSSFSFKTPDVQLEERTSRINIKIRLLPIMSYNWSPTPDKQTE